MKTASVTDLKNNLSAHLKEVIAGEPLLVTDRKKPVAIFQSLGSRFFSERLSGLVASGVVSAPGRKLDLKAFFREPKGTAVCSLSDAIAEDREAR